MLMAVFFLILMVVFPEQAAKGALDGLRLCGTRVIPSLFPFFVVSRLITLKMPRLFWPGMNRLFGVSGSVLPALVLSFLGGYPVGVSTLVSLQRQGQISRQDAERAMSFCNNTGPGLFIGLLGGTVFRSSAAGLALYLIHMVSALCCGMILSRGKSTAIKRQCPSAELSLPKAMTEAVTGAAASMLQVCSYVLLFSVLTGLLNASSCFRLLPETMKAAIMGALEITGGVSRLEATRNGFIAASAIMGWGGLCVHMQAMSIWQEAGLHPTGYFHGKILHSLLSAALAALLCRNFRIFGAAAAGVLSLAVLFRLIQKKQVEKRKRLVYNEIAR